jgi:hypothetical protein
MQARPGIAAIVLLVVVGSLSGDPVHAADYYVDCRAGSDDADGLSAATAWQTVAKVSATTFSPGDAILFKRGTRCAGTLWPKGSGEPGQPIRLGSYGTGPLPVIDAGSGRAAIALFNQQHWDVETIEAVGGTPYGIHISGDEGVLRHLHIRNVVVRDVGGEPKTKASGLIVVAAGGGDQTFEDVVIDGVTAHHTTQWAGIIVKGSAKGDGSVRARNVTIRNSIVHDVHGDGIVLFQVEDGLIEKSAAWRTGLQPRETIGTPNGIWTWRCRRCTVQWTEGFFIDSPGVDGGVYDIDWGCDDNVVQYNFGHDAMGYCASVFGAGGETTTNSVIRYNVCAANGRSPKLALRQGDLYISTWEGGALDGVRIHNNTFYWSPPIDAPVLQMEPGHFAGSRPNVFENNLVYSRVPSMIRSNGRLRFDHNLYWYTGAGEPQWDYGGREWRGFTAYRQGSGQDAAGVFADPNLSATLRLGGGSPAIDAGAIVAGAASDAFGTMVPQGKSPDIGAIEHQATAMESPGGQTTEGDRWRLVSHLADDGDSRAQVVFLQAAVEQFGERGLAVAVVLREGVADDLRHDWNLGSIHVMASQDGRDVRRFPTTHLVAPDGTTLRTWEGLAPPADLGLTLRALIGPPAGSLHVDLARRR